MGDLISRTSLFLGLSGSCGVLLLFMFGECIEYFVEVAVHYSINIAPAFFNSMIGNSVLGEIICSYLFGTVAGANLAPSFFGDISRLFDSFNFKKFGSEKV